MEWLPVGRVSVPVEAGSRVFRVYAVVSAHLLHDGLIGRTILGILADQVAPFVPGDPLSASLPLLLESFHLFDEFIVH